MKVFFASRNKSSFFWKLLIKFPFKFSFKLSFKLLIKVSIKIPFKFSFKFPFKFSFKLSYKLLIKVSIKFPFKFWIKFSLKLSCRNRIDSKFVWSSALILEISMFRLELELTPKLMALWPELSFELSSFSLLRRLELSQFASRFGNF